MGIKLSESSSRSAVVFDKVHVSEIKIEQPMFEDDTRPPYYKVSIEYRLYGVDSQKVRQYEGKAYEVEVKDFYAVAVNQMVNGDPRLIQALATIEHAIASIIAGEMGVSTEVI